MVDLRDAIVAALTWISMVNLQETNVISCSIFLLMALPVHLTAVAGLPSFSNSSSPINENLLFDLIIYRTIEIRFWRRNTVEWDVFRVICKGKRRLLSDPAFWILLGDRSQPSLLRRQIVEVFFRLRQEVEVKSTNEVNAFGLLEVENDEANPEKFYWKLKRVERERKLCGSFLSLGFVG